MKVTILRREREREKNAKKSREEERKKEMKEGKIEKITREWDKKKKGGDYCLIYVLSLPASVHLRLLPHQSIAGLRTCRNGLYCHLDLR
jgi:hypothetical protein